MRLILLNGPPRSGKDTAGAMIVEALGLGAQLDKFARIVKERTHAAYGLMMGGFPFRHDAFEDRKDQPLAAFLGATPRQAYIAFSERFYKPLHGGTVFGHLLAQDLAYSSATTIIVTDSGFREEAEALLNAMGAENAVLLRLHRDGCDFSRDSRGYVDLSDLGVRCEDVYNPGDGEGLRRNLAEALPEMRAPVRDQAGGR